MSTSILRFLMALALIAIAGCSSSGTTPELVQGKWHISGTPLDRSAARLENDTYEHLAWADTYRKRIVSVNIDRTIGNTLEPYSEMMMHIDAARAECELFARVHPNADVRAAAESGEQVVAKRLTGLSLDRELYHAMRMLDVSKADAPTQFVMEKILRNFRRAGVDKSDDARERIAELNDTIVALGQAFAKNTRDDERQIALASPADLDGLPVDWIARHQPDPDGKIRVTTQYPDYFPYMTYAHNADARLALYREFKSRGYPANIDVLDQLLAKRNELAILLGYANWAEYITEDKMIETPANARAFIDRIAEAGKQAADREYDALLQRKRQDVSGATGVEDWEKTYYETLVKNEKFAFDPQSLRPYFNFTDTLDGLFRLTEKMFGVTYHRVHGLNLWHPDVTAWDVFEGRTRIGRFYLDLHPRPDKYGHAAQFDYRTGIADKRLPEAVLVCNFPNPKESADGVALMEHSEVTTLFHEFGHLLHAIFSGHRKWMGNAGIVMEWDFVEAPSQMLEEWCFDPGALQIFAKHYQTGEPIPLELVEKLRRASDFGKGLYAAHQMFYAAVSLNYYDRDPANVDTTRLLIELQDKYSPFAYVPDTHFQCSFGHLDGYSAIYYTYMWSKVIAKDIFSRFERDGVLNTRTARAYRKAILDPGGSKKASELVKDFLGRPQSFEAYEKWLDRT